MPSFPCHNYTIIEGGFLQNYNSSEYRCFNVIQFPLIFPGDKIIEPPLFVRKKAFVVIFFVNEKRLCEKVSVAYQQALIGTTKCMITDIVLMLRLRDDGSVFDIGRPLGGRLNLKEISTLTYNSSAIFCYAKKILSFHEQTYM